MASTGSSLQHKLAATRQWWRTTRAIRGAAWAVCAAGTLALICYQSDSHLVLSPSARVVWRMAILLAGIGILLISLLYSMCKRLPDTAVAAEVERCYPTLQERLLSTIELAPTLAGADGSGFSRQMTLSLEDDTNAASRGLNFRRAVSTRSVRNAIVASLVVIGLLMIQRMAAPESFDNWLNRMRNPAADIPVWANTRVWVTPEHDLLPIGEGDRVSITTRGVKASASTLYYRLAGDKNGAWKTVELTNPVAAFDHPSASGARTAAVEKPDAYVFHCKLPALSHSIELYASANDGRSNDKTVVVEPRPTLLNVKLTLHYPAYMHRSALVIPISTGNIGAPVGAQIDFEASANKPLKTAVMYRDSREVGPLPVAGSGASGHLSITRDGTYAIALTDTHSFANALPTPVYEIKAMPDLPPTVQIMRPTTDLDLVPDGSIPLVAHASDDYGVTQVKLVYNRQHPDAMARTGAAAMKSVGQGSLSMPLASPGTQVNISERWHLASTHGQVGDTVQFEVDAVDNDTLNGPHVGRSSSLSIHLVSLLEMQQKLKLSLDEEARALEQLRKSQIDAQHQLEQARAKMDPAALARAQEAQRSVAEEAKSITDRVQDVTAQLENNNLGTKSELERRAAAEQTLQAIAQQKAPQAADAVQNAAAAKAPREARNQDVAHADRQETDIRHDIEKAQDLLARTPSADQLAAEAKRLAADQERLADTARSIFEGIKEHKQQTGSNALTPELKIGVDTERQQQQQTNQDTNRLQTQLNRAATAAQERGQQKQADALHQAANALQKANVAAQQAQAQQNLNQAHPEQAAPHQDRAAKGLEDAAQAAQQAAADEPNGNNTAEQLEKTAAQLHELARQQRDVAGKTAQNPNEQQSHDLANQERNIQNQANDAQQGLNGAQQAQQSLQKAQQNLSQAGKQLSQNQAQQAQSPANQAAKNLENAANQAENAAQQIRQQQAASELADRVDRLAQIQTALKTQTERLQNTRQQRPLTRNENGELGQVAARQQNVEEETRAIAERFPSPAFQKALQNAARQAHPATENLNPPNNQPPDTGLQTQAAQAKAAQTLTAVAQALKQQAQANRDQQNQDQDQQQQQANAQQEEEAAALGELLLAQGLQQQVRQNTGQVDQHRHNQPLTQMQQEDVKQIAGDQQDTHEITDHAADTLSQIPGIEEMLHSATQHMDQSHNGLTQQQTGQPTQTQQDSAIQDLAQAQKRVQEAMQQQQQQQQAQQQARQGAPQPTHQPGAQPDHNAFTRLEGPGADGARSSPIPGSGKFAALSDRAQRTLREGKQEKVPAEFQDLVSRYYKSLAERK